MQSTSCEYVFFLFFFTIYCVTIKRDAYVVFNSEPVNALMLFCLHTATHECYKNIYMYMNCNDTTHTGMCVLVWQCVTVCVSVYIMYKEAYCIQLKG